MRLITLDPATHVTGFAYWFDGVLKGYGIIRAIPDDNFDYRCLSINSKLRNMIVDKGFTDCVSEFPEFQQGSKGMTAARGGDTLKLSYLCGCISVGWQLHAAQNMKGPNLLGKVSPMVEFVRPSKWKGQLPKHVTADRCFSKYGWKAKGDLEMNASDAIMIGDWYLKLKGIPTGYDPDAQYSVL